MYKDFFGLKEIPFTIAPDPRYLFMSERHRDALAHLLYGIGEGGGFVLLTGEVGTGKTTVCRCLLEQLPSNVSLAYILNPKLNSIELMATMCDELGIEYPKGEDSLKTFTDLLSQYLLMAHNKGLNTVLMIDEAQNLSVDVLEQIRLLTNLETNQKKLLQIILIGQPELQELLAKKELRQLAQRITARYHLRPLSEQETQSYLDHRLRIAGLSRPLMTKLAITKIYKASQGIPRVINVISERALLGAFTQNEQQVTDKIVDKAAKEVLGEQSFSYAESKNNTLSLWKWFAIVSFACACIFLGLVLYHWQGDRKEQTLVDMRESQQAVPKRELRNIAHTDDDLTVQKSVSGTNEDSNLDELAAKFWGNQAWDRTGVIGFKNLFALWGVDFIPYQSEKPCRFAKSYGLACDRGAANWQLLRQLNRPVNLKFSTKNAGEFWGSLIYLDGATAKIQFGVNQVEIPLERLNLIWTGDYVLLWKKPQGMSKTISLGQQGQAVKWLIDSIEDIDGLTVSAVRYNERIKNWVEKFQQQNSLIVDGVVGKHTVILINGLTIKNIPTLNGEL